MKFTLVLLGAVLCLSTSAAAQGWPFHSSPNNNGPTFSTDNDSAQRDAEISSVAANAAADANSAHERAKGAYVLGSGMTYNPPPPSPPGTTPAEINALAAQFRKIRLAREAREAETRKAAAAANQPATNAAPDNRKPGQNQAASSQ